MSNEEPNIIESIIIMCKNLKLMQETYKDSGFNQNLQILQKEFSKAQSALQNFADTVKSELQSQSKEKELPEYIKNAKIDFLNRQSKAPRK